MIWNSFEGFINAEIEFDYLTGSGKKIKVFWAQIYLDIPCQIKWLIVGRIHWLVSNFIPMDSKKFRFRNFDFIIRFAIKNKSEIKKMRSRERRIFEKNRFYLIRIRVSNRNMCIRWYFG